MIVTKNLQCFYGDYSWMLMMLKIEKDERPFSMHLEMDYSDGPYSPQSPSHGIYSSPSPTHGLSFAMVKVRFVY